MTNTSVTLSSLYSSGQCLLSVLGSIGVILLFAGIPQLIYAPQVNPGSLMTFLLGALLISFMVAGNAFIGYKYRQLVRERRAETRARNNNLRPSSLEDKPPSYDELLKEEGLPPAYATIITGKPPRYEDLVAEVFNWEAISNVPEQCQITDTHPENSAPVTYPREMPIIVPIQKHIVETSDENRSFLSSRPILRRESENLQKYVQKLNPTCRRTSCGNPPSQAFNFPRPSIQYSKETETNPGSSKALPRFSFSNIPSVHERTNRKLSKDSKTVMSSCPETPEPTISEGSESISSRL